MVYASHVLEHVDFQRVHFALTEAHRVLKPGGWIEVHTVDFERIALNWIEEYRDWDNDPWLNDPKGHLWNEHNDLMFWVNARLFNYAKDGNEHHQHRSCFDESWLRRCLERAGFVDVKRLNFTRTRDHGKINLGMRGTKP
jgi:predicted SAM-dependent methyltransferase